MRAGEDTLRHAIAKAADGVARGRLRVELAELVRARDVTAARAELDLAAREAGVTPMWTAATLSLARALPAAERLAWLRELTRAEDKPPAAPLVSALADALMAADQPQEAAAIWLALARDERMPLHHRRAAAKRAARAGGRAGSETGPAALLVDLGVDRRDPRRRRRKEPGGVPEAAPAAPSGGIVAATLPGTVAAVRRPGTSGPLPAPATRRRRPRTDHPPSLFEQALEEARGGRRARARRLGDEAIRAAPPGPEAGVRAAALEAVLREAGGVEEALLLRRTQLESLEPEVGRPALLALAAEAASAGFAALATAWSSDAGAPALVAHEGSSGDRAPETPAEHYRAAQRLLARGDEADGAVLLVHLRAALSGHAGADAALALATSRIDGGADPAAAARQRIELLRTAHTGERTPARRARLSRRLAEALEKQGDALGAVAVLETMLSETASQRMSSAGAAGPSARDATWARGERARLLRALGRSRELATALERDAGALAGEARLEALAELATLLDRTGEPEKALEIRRMALAEFPGASAVLGEARRHLEATGRTAESLALAHAALESTVAPDRRRQLLRDVAQLTERLGTSVNASAAAEAWLALLDSDPEDDAAATAAERFLVATGEWERCAELLACRAARGPKDRRALLWRLAELRRARGQIDEATRLYVELAGDAAALPPLPDPPAVAALARRDPAVAVDSARAAAAPTPADRARALADRARALADRGHLDDARRDVLAALDGDPRNAEALRLLDALYSAAEDAAALATELGRRGAKLPPADAAPLFTARGRAAARAGDRAAARDAYRRAMALDPTLAEPIAELARLAARDGDWSQVAALLNSEAALTTSPPRKAALLIELAIVHGDRLNGASRAVELLEEAAALLPNDPRVLDLGARFKLAAGQWAAAAEALDQLAGRGETIADAAQRYHAVGAAAEADGEIDRALTLYSRSYARDATFRPTLERLSAICFERGQWDNAWKATEALLNRHGAALETGAKAICLARSALSDLHVGQRTAAASKLGEVVSRSGSYAPDAGIRDVAESWAGMHLEPRLLVGMDNRRRERALSRAQEALVLADAESAKPPPIPGSEAARGDQRPAVAAAGRLALEIVGAVALAEGRLEDAQAALELLATDEGLDAVRRGEYLLTAGDIVARQTGEPRAAEEFYARARALWPSAPRFGRPPEMY